MAPFYKSLVGLRAHNVSPHQQETTKFEATPKFVPAPSQQQGLFFKLPAEIRNEIYELVFIPPTCEDGLFPSVEIMKCLGLLFTCRQINVEAMAYAPNFFLTNRWHRTDLQEIQQYLERYQTFSARFNALPFTLTTLTLVTEKRRPHLNSNSTREFLDFGGDYAKFVWNVVNLFPTVEKVEIEINQRTKLLPLALFRCLSTDKWIDREKEAEDKADDKAEAWNALKGIGSDGGECIWLEKRQVMNEPWRKVRKKVRRVEVTCTYGSVIRKKGF